LTTVLIIEDEATLSDLLRTLLQDEGYAVLTASTFAEAEAAVRRSPVDLVVADLIEFDEHGLAGAAQALRELAGERPILLCTGQPGAQRLAAEWGFSGVLDKPFDLDVLLERVRSALARSGPRPDPTP
jgi:DNA-binding response OmpR family regulator